MAISRVSSCESRPTDRSIKKRSDDHRDTHHDYRRGGPNRNELRRSKKYAPKNRTYNDDEKNDESSKSHTMGKTTPRPQHQKHNEHILIRRGCGTLLAHKRDDQRPKNPKTGPHMAIGRSTRPTTNHVSYIRTNQTYIT